MTEADRLRAAADAFAARADRDVWYYESHGEQHPSVCPSCDEDRATAALLRAVADLDPDTPLDISLRFLADKAFHVGGALADAILRGEK